MMKDDLRANIHIPSTRYIRPGKVLNVHISAESLRLSSRFVLRTDGCHAQQLLVPQKDNAEMRAIFVGDQTDRGNNPFYEPGVPEPRPVSGLEMRKNDDLREVRVKHLIDSGSLHTASDYFRAALVFQHAYKAEDQLFAHVLATMAISKGSGDALWLSAATLDRYLVSIGKQQIFGTQFSSSPQHPSGIVWHEEPVSPLLSDALRADLCVVPLALQTKDLPAQISSTSLVACPAAKALDPPEDSHPKK